MLELDAADEEVSDQELTQILQRLVDCGQLVRVRRSDAAPVHYVASSAWPYDAVDSLEADIVSVMREHDDRGYSEESELKSWLTEAGVEFDERSLGQAIGHLFMLNRLQTPRPEEWSHPGPRPTWLVPPRIAIG